ncbi:hypothetical protein ACFSX9_08620 [Flavobacterium ardleyense]|uniref:Uncharacterized protein n=1 Tax=Flavobacterium ardleyense TaxID=2038737 RepID=A0ABW5Z7N3_9FLAO
MRSILYLLFFVCTFGFAQSDTLHANLKSYKLNDQTTFKPFIWKSSFANNNYSFSSYNSATRINSNYTKVGDNYFLSNTKTFSTINIMDLNRIDSFNPYGSTNIGAALIMGTLNLILQKN